MPLRPEGAERLAYWRSRLAEELGKRPQDGLSDGTTLTPIDDSLPQVRLELLEPYFDNEGRPRPARELSRFADSDDDPFYISRDVPQRL